MTTKEFELIPTYDKEKGIYTIKNFENCKEIVKTFLEECYLDQVITNEYDFKNVKSTRTDIRKKKETISTARKQIKEMLIGTFENQLKEIESMLKDADETLKNKVNEWELEHKNKVLKPTIITLTIKGYDVKKIEKVRDYAIKNGLEVKEG